MLDRLDPRRSRPLWVAAVVAVGIAGVGVGSAASRPRILSGVDLWAGAGAATTSYKKDYTVATGGGGAGLRFADWVGIGAAAHGDRERYFVFGYAALYFPPLGYIEPYGRVLVGARDDLDGETAFGWSAGIQTGNRNIKLFVEATGVIDPGYVYGGSLGLSLYLMR